MTTVHKSFSILGAVLIAFVLMLGSVQIASAAAPNWDVTGSWTFNDIYLGVPYVHTMEIDAFDSVTGIFSGTGFYNDVPALTWDVNGVVSGDDITVFHLLVTGVDPGVTIDGTGTINVAGTLMSGTGYQSNLPGGDPNIEWTAVGVAIPREHTAPAVSAVVVSPVPPIAGQPTTLTANVNDTATGNSNIASAEYRITGGAWMPMNAVDAFNTPNENVTVGITFATPGIKEVCVRGTDAWENTSSPGGDDCTIVTVIDPLVGYVSGGGNIKDGKGKPTWTFGGNAGTVPGVGLVGQLQVVNHTTKVACHYNTIHSLTVVGGLAAVSASGKCNNGTTVGPTALTYFDGGEPGTADKFGGQLLAGGNIKVGEKVVQTVTTFTATDSAYYNGLNVGDGLYATGPITFTWDGAGNVTGGLWDEIYPANVGTNYYNIVTGGTVIGGVVNLTLQRTNPSNYGPFTIVGTLVGNVLTGTADGPYLFTATGVITP